MTTCAHDTPPAPAAVCRALRRRLPAARRGVVLHRLALVRRDRLPGGLRTHAVHAEPVALRDGTGGDDGVCRDAAGRAGQPCSPRAGDDEPGRPGLLQPQSTPPAGTRHGTIRRRRAAFRPAGRVGLGIVADGVERAAVWHDRPDPGQGRRVLRVPAAVARGRAVDAAWPGRGGAHRHRGRLRCGGHHQLGRRRRTASGPCGQAARVDTGGRVVPRLRLWRVAGRASPAGDCFGPASRRHQRRRRGDDPGPACAAGGGSDWRRPGPGPDEDRLVVAAAHRGCPLRRRERRRHRRRRGDAALRHRAQRAGARAAVHRAQHRRHARRLRAGQR